MMHDRGGFAIFYKLILYWELWIRGEKEKRRHHIEPKLIFFFWVKNKQMDGTSLGGPVWLGHHTFTAGGKGSIPGQRTKISYAALCGQKIEKKKKKKNKQVEEKET